MTCQDVVERVTDYVERALLPAETTLFEGHLRSCEGCHTYLEQMQQLARSLGAVENPAVTPATRESLHNLFQSFCREEKRSKNLPVRLGIGEEYVATGEHIGYFWENESQFEEALGFLAVGLRGKDACFVFGHDDANRKVLDLLARRGLDVEALVEAGRLQVLGGEESGDEMLAKIGAAFQRAVDNGAPLLRLLGNIGWRRPGWPVDDNILAFEAKVTEAARQFPCLVICLYDVHALPGRIILKGGLETHPLTMSATTLHENPHYQSPEQFLSELKGGRTLDSVH